ncbi:hypothetical protein VNO78_31564 [Psophocarpus tetragonolobus]|uniref:Uncharacterized protein n=1 Tax=Psophocarpus tetragonolobus TaxID=3891 RepID=A0AAN9S0J7_PSOTE
MTEEDRSDEPTVRNGEEVHTLQCCVDWWRSSVLGIEEDCLKMSFPDLPLEFPGKLSHNLTFISIYTKKARVWKSDAQGQCVSGHSIGWGGKVPAL